MVIFDDGLRVARIDNGSVGATYGLVRHGVPVTSVDRFLRFLADRNMSPNTQRAYTYDLRHFMRFLEVDARDWSRPDLLRGSRPGW